MPVSIFISHASADETLAGALVDCILSSLSVADDAVRCTSVPGHKLPVGTQTATAIRDELNDTAVVVGLLTPTALTSGWVLFELGASWGARRTVVPLLVGRLAFKDLPGPLSGHHAVRLTDKNGMLQALQEIAGQTGAPLRSAAKVGAAVDKLVAAAKEYEVAMKQPRSATAVRTPPEPKFAGTAFSDLFDILRHEKVTIPANVAGQPKERTGDLAGLFLANHKLLADGVQNNWEGDGHFMYHEIALRLLPFKLVKFEKLPAAQAKWFKRLVLSDEGLAFVAHWRKLSRRKSSAK